MRYDVVVVGGGLAGLALSIDLAGRGKSVVVIEKGSYPRHKVCGEYISMESHSYLFGLCPEIEALNLPFISRFKLTSIGNSVFETKLDLGGFGVSRFVLEEMLYKKAISKGVNVITDTKVLKFETHENGAYLISTSFGQIEGKLLCNSSGRKSNIEVKENIDPISKTNYVGVKYHLKLERAIEQIEIHNFPGGYCGISAIENGSSCLCYIVNADNLKKVNNSIAELEKEFLFRNKNLRSIFESAEFLYESPLTISGINFKIKKAATQDSFYLGDAAGSIAPITGNGMSIALRSSSKLAAEIHKFFDGIISKEELLRNYNVFWKSQFETRIKLSRHLQKLSESTFLANATISLFNKFPFVAGNVIKMTHGKPF